VGGCGLHSSDARCERCNELLRFYKMPRISLLSEQLSASQRELSCLGIVVV
jgi:hypothetical protein